MPNISILKLPSGNLEFSFGDYATQDVPTKEVVLPQNINKFYKAFETGNSILKLLCGEIYELSGTEEIAPTGRLVDSVNNVPVTNNEDLYVKLKALL